MAQSGLLKIDPQHSICVVLPATAWVACVIALVVILAQIAAPSISMMASIAHGDDASEMRTAPASIDASMPMHESPMRCCDSLLAAICPFASGMVLHAEACFAIRIPSVINAPLALHARAVLRTIPVPRPRPKIG